MQTTMELAETEGLNITVAMGMERALAKYYAGLVQKKEALDEEEDCGVSTYYAWKKAHPDLVQYIEDRARLKALKHQRGEDVAWEARQKRSSHELQEKAIEALKSKELIPAMLDVALGGHRSLTMMADGKNGPYEKIYNIISYPRDQVEAVRRLQELARGGALPEAKAETLEFLDRLTEERTDAEYAEEEAEDTGTKLEDIGFGMGVGTRFTKITAETADGRTITAEVKDNIDVIEGDSCELGNS